MYGDGGGTGEGAVVLAHVRGSGWTSPEVISDLLSAVALESLYEAVGVPRARIHHCCSRLMASIQSKPFHGNDFAILATYSESGIVECLFVCAARFYMFELSNYEFS